MGGFRLGKVFGIEIRIDASWLIIFFLVLWTFTAGVFPARYPGLTGPLYIGMGVSGTLLFFVSVLLHELAHSLVARTKGIEVEGITLFVFGGMAHARSEFDSAKDEFVIAGAGPLSSFLIAGTFWIIAWGGQQLGWSVAITGVASYLAVINLILAIFNLLPGFPLDGGRLFRAVVWHVTGNLTRATRFAAIGGRVLGFMLIGLGLLQLFAGGFVGGLWLILIGWFVQLAASSAYAQHLLRTSLEGVHAGDAMTSEVQTVSPELTLRQFVDLYRFRGRHEAYPVVDGDEPVGLIAFRQIREVPRGEWDDRTVRDTMNRLENGSVVGPEAEMVDVMEKMQGTRSRQLLVMDDGKLLGILTAGDVTRWLERAQLLG